VKEYPKAVVLRKSLISIGILVLASIVILILYNLYSASHSQQSKQKYNDSSVQAVAGVSDTIWYQHQSIKKSVESPNTSVQLTPTVPKSSTPMGKNQTTESPQELAASQLSQQNLLRAMSAPISSNQLSGDHPQSGSSGILGSAIIAPAGDPTNPDSDQNLQMEKKAFLNSISATSEDYLSSVLKNPISKYELQAGTIIPGMLITGIDSDLPGQITGQVKSNVYDSMTGRYLLVPQGSKISGIYDSQVAYGQDRVLVAWKRIIFPNGQSIDLGGMPGADLSGYAGFNDQVDNHYKKIFGSIVLMSVLGAGAQLSQAQSNNNSLQAPTVGQTIAQSLGTNIAATGTMITAKNINIQPTLKIRQGYEFNITVTKDMVFPGAYAN